MKKILFPFFNKERHSFLTSHWWFILLIVLYIIGLIIFLYHIWGNLIQTQYGWCFDNLYLYANNGFNSPEWLQQVSQCNKIRQESLTLVILGPIIITFVVHYIIQFIFFKIIINYILLGSKNTKREKDQE